MAVAEAAHVPGKVTVIPLLGSFHRGATYVIIQVTGYVDEGVLIVDEGIIVGVDEGFIIANEGNIIGVGSQLDPVFKDVVTGDPAFVQGQPPASVVAEAAVW